MRDNYDGDGNRGKIVSPEAREKISVALRGRTLLPETCEKLRLSKQNISQETRAKISETQKARWARRKLVTRGGLQ